MITTLALTFSRRVEYSNMYHDHMYSCYLLGPRNLPFSPIKSTLFITVAQISLSYLIFCSNKALLGRGDQRNDSNYFEMFNYEIGIALKETALVTTTPLRCVSARMPSPVTSDSRRLLS